MSKTDSVARILALAGGTGGGGGTGGTSNYNDLTNKPQINGTTLTGNKTLNELGITADNLNVYTKEETTNAINGAVNDKADTSYVDTQLDLKADKTALGDLSNLVTDDKSSAVAAINEIKEKGVTEEVLTQALAQESSARQKQDSLLEEEIADKLAPANIKAGNGINVEQSGLDVTISSVDLSNPDWSISDPEDPSYIKNRTHYSTTNITNVYDDNATRMNLSRGANGVNWYVAQINTASAGVDFSQVDVVNLTLGKVEYTNIIKNSVTVDDNGVQTEVYYFGNQLAMSSFSPYEGAIDTGEPFTILVDSDVILVCLRTENVSGYVYTNIKLDAVVSETIHKLDNKYLDILKDSTISTETGYSSFKIEESLAQLDNKYVTLEDKSINITWDGNTADKVVSTPVGLYKVSGNVYNGVDLLGASVSLSDGTTVEVTEFLENNTPATVIAIDNARVVIIRQANYKDNEGYTYPETGVYFSHISSIYVNSFTKLDVQEIGGTKNFVGEVTVNEPVQDTNPATKKYVDDSTSDKITINDIPTELPNPESLTIQVNGANLDTYDGSEVKTVNIQAATEEYVKQLISTIQTASFEVVDTLPESDIKSNAIYLVPSNVSGLNNIYDEYIYVNNKWELIGNTSIDLSQYATKEYVDDKDINNVKYTTDNNVELKNHIVTPFGSGLYGNSPDNGWTNLAAVKGYNLDAENEIIQTELGSATLHTNINSKDRPTIETSEGQEQVRYLSDTEIDDKSSSKTTTYSSNKIDSLKPVMLSVPVRTKKDKVYTQEEILAWFKVTSISDLKLLFTRDNPLFAKYGITLSTLPHYYKMNVEYAAFESANQIKLVFLGLDTSNDEPSRFTIIANLDGTIIESNSNVQLVIEPLSKSSYNDLLDKPTINNIELKDNVSLDDLNLMDKEQVQSAINSIIDDSKPSLTKTYSSSKIESLSGVKVLTGTNEKPIIANDLSIGTYVISGIIQSSQSNTTNITVPKKLYSVDKTDLGAAIWYENPKTSQQTYYEFRLEGNEAPTQRLQTYVTTEYLSSATLDGGTWI